MYDNVLHTILASQLLVHNDHCWLVNRQERTDQGRERDTNCCWWPLGEYLRLEMCVGMWTITSLLFAFLSQSVDSIRERMRTGRLYERKHIDNCQYKTEEEICGNNRHDQLLPLFLAFFVSFHSYSFSCLSFSFFRTWSGLGLIFSLSRSLSVCLSLSLSCACSHLSK